MSQRAKIAILLGLIALIPRFVYLSQYVRSPYYGTVFLDEQYHYDWASAIAHGRILGDDAFFRAPLYSYLLGGLFAATGPDLLLPRVVQLFLGAFAAVLVFLLGDRLFGRRAGVLAWAFAAFYGPSIFHEAELLDVVLQLVLLPAILLVALRLMERPGIKTACALGLLTGLCALARPNILLFVPFLAAIALWSTWRSIGRTRLAVAGLCFAGTMALAILPATIHNAITGRAFVPIATYGGINLYLGNNPNADGHTPRTRRHYYAFDRYRDSVELFAIREAEARTGRAMNGAEASRFWTAEAFRFVLSQPAGFLRLLARKFAFFWNDLEIKNNKDVAFVGRRIPALGALMSVGRWGVLAPIGLAGLAMALAWRRSPGVILTATLLVVFMVSVILFFVSDRHRLPAAPLLAVFAGHAVDRMIDFARRRRWGPLAGAVAGVCGLGALILPHWFDIGRDWPARDWWTVGNCYKDKGQLDEAQAAYRRALDLAPKDPDIWNNLGEVFYQQRRGAEAEDCFRQAVQTDPSYVRALNNLGVCLEERNALDEAQDCFGRVLSMAPDYVLARQNLGEVRLKQGRWREALDLFDLALAQWPASALSHLGRARALQALGRGEEARKALQRALELGGEPIRRRAEEAGLGMPTETAWGKPHPTF